MFRRYAVFILYCLVMLWQLFIGPYRIVAFERSFNLVPFATIGELLAGPEAIGFHLWFINLFGNILTFIPLGLLLPSLFPKLRGFVPLLISTFLIITAAELIQYLANVGTFDVDDLILNVIGCCMGFGLHKLIMHRRLLRLAQL